MAVITHFTCGLAPRTIQTINHLQINSVYSVSDTRPSAAFSYRILSQVKKLHCMLLNTHATDNVFPQLFPDTVPLLPHQTENLIHVNISESLSDRSSFPGLSLSPVRWFGEELKPHRERSAISCPGRWAFIIWANKHLAGRTLWSPTHQCKVLMNARNFCSWCFTKNQQLFFASKHYLGWLCMSVKCKLLKVSSAVFRSLGSGLVRFF